MYKKAHCLPVFGFRIPVQSVTVCLTPSMATELYGKVRVATQPGMDGVCGGGERRVDGARSLSDLGVRRLAEFEYVGGQQAFYRSFNKYFEEEVGELSAPPLPIRSPPLLEKKGSSSAFKTETKTFGKSVAFN